MEDQKFPSYPRNSSCAHSFYPYNHSRTQVPSRLPPDLTVHHQQGFFDPNRHPPPLVVADSQPYLPSPHPMMAPKQGYFKDFVRDPEHLYLPNHPQALHTTLEQPLTAYGSFRPLHSGQPAPHPTTIIERPVKLANTLSLPVPNILAAPVDVSKYEMLSYRDWLTAHPEYDSRSPSTINSEGDLPPTPSDMEYDSSFATGVAPKPATFGTLQAFPPPMASPAYPLGAPGYPHPVDAPYTHMHGLPSFGSVSEYSQPRALPFQPHTHAIEGPSASPQDLELQNSFSTQHDDDNESMMDYEDEDEASTSSAASSSSELDNTNPNTSRKRGDLLLLQMREDGIPYKEIKRLGRFKEAESTLRGRWRSLTKEKDERVRRPMWKANDITLLRRAVRHYSDGGGSSGRLRAKAGSRRSRMPWKKVSEWVKKHGGSYLFAPATCARKWDEIEKKRE